MAKRVDNNATMEVTESQLLDLNEAQAKRRPIPPASTNRNDVSLWAHRIVGADEFAPPRPARAPRVRRWLVALLVVVILGAGGYVAYTRYVAPAPVPPAAPAAAPSAAPTAPPAPTRPKPASKPAPKPAKNH